MYDLKNAIREWRCRLARSESMTGENFRELEGHLRDTITELSGMGLSEREAFLVAADRMGAPDALDEEYGKINGASVWRRRVVWILCGYLGGISFGHLIDGVCGVVQGVAAVMGFGGVAAATTSVAVAALSWSVLLWLLFRLTRRQGIGSLGETVPVRWLVGVAAMAVMGIGFGAAGGIFHARVVSVDMLGQTAYWWALGSFGVRVCVFLACLGTIFTLNRTRQDPSSGIA